MTTVLSVICMLQTINLLPITVYSIMSRLNVFSIFFVNVFYFKQPFEWKFFGLGILALFGITLVVCPYIYGFKSNVTGPALEFGFTIPEIVGFSMVMANIVANGFNEGADVGVLQSVFMVNMFLTLLSCFFMMYFPIHWEWSELQNYLGISLGTWIYQILYVEAMKRLPDSHTVALIQTTVILFSMAVDFWVMGISVSFINLVGALLIMVCTIAPFIRT